MNREEKAIVAAFQNGTINAIAAEYARCNERGFKYNWTVEQHETDLTQKAQSLLTECAPAANTAKAAPAKTFNTGFGYYGTARDAARGFDGIE